MSRLAKLLFLSLLDQIVPRSASQLTGSQLKVSGQSVVDQLLHLSRYSVDPAPAVTRVLFTEADTAARRYVKELFQDAGLKMHEDPMGNIFGRWEGSDSSAGAVMTGSHCDAIPLSGLYDGTVGVIGGAAAVKALRQAGYAPAKTIEVIMFTSEEPTRFGLGCIGSRGMAGTLTPEVLDARPDENGTLFKHAAQQAGYGASSHKAILDGTLLKGKRKVDAFVELHIEQGPRLEAEGAAIGVVEEAVLATGAPDTVGTAGRWDLSPNTVNSVPREASLEVDIRDIDGARRDQVVAAVRKAAGAIAGKRKVRHEVEVVNQDDPATCGSEVTSAVAASVKDLGLSSLQLVSRAYHDALFMAQIAPSGMIFIPCRHGWSHRPDEYSSPEAIENGVKVLALTLARLAGQGVDVDRSEL
ncbi:hypothetical protein WJX74_007312 [Apatococcus lobatus]|uniref:Uncharacterized protein n=1 Tax=Apatococcus lobatus TaxID=904363 RepID=A0AAW1PZR6_9CHLO